MHRYHNLLEPYDFGFLTLRNRMIMGAMHTRMETLDDPIARQAEFFRERARGEVGLILTGGFSPNMEGRIDEEAPTLHSMKQIPSHRAITHAVHAEGGKIVLQILHAGRYGKHSLCVGPTDQRAPINAYSPRPLDIQDIVNTVQAISTTAKLAQDAGYDGVEIMGSEGYLLNQFTSPQTNTRSDDYGGCFEGRIRLAIETVNAVRTATGPEFLLVYRISAVDLVQAGMPGDETARFAQCLQQSGVHMLNTGIGWHESAIPTIAASVPRAGWQFAVHHVKRAVSIPVIASNRINTPDAAEALLAAGVADFVSMARPLLADPEFARKTRHGQPKRINSCIACNQVCLDHIFTDRVASCLVNPRACRELDYPPGKTSSPKRIAVVGGGAAGMAFAVYAAERGNDVVLLEASNSLGGQINLARKVPGKSEFNEALRYFQTRLAELKVQVVLGKRIQAADLYKCSYDLVVLATGVAPRIPAIEGIDHHKVAYYDEVLSGRRVIGKRVAIIGTGGIAFDTADFLLTNPMDSVSTDQFQHFWGVDASLANPGGLMPITHRSAARSIHMFQRGNGKPGARLGKSTGWILKTKLKRAGVTLLPGVIYHSISDAGIEYSCNGATHVLPVDNVIVCAGQVEHNPLSQPLTEYGVRNITIGGANAALELDAARAIEEALRLAATL